MAGNNNGAPDLRIQDVIFAIMNGMLGVHAQEPLEEPEVMTLRRNELRSAAYYVQFYTINMEYWRSRL
eukprot:14183182-Alexandrium_andersonii.AAC.1